MIDLKDCTFIIPIKIEHEDRYRNSKSVLGFLNHHFNTNVIIYEISNDLNSNLDFLKDLKNLKISHSVNSLNDKDFFHRTEYLNIMLDKVKTPVVINYDIDVILPVDSYTKCRDEIINGEIDAYYPYVFGKGQYKIPKEVSRDNFHSDYIPESLLDQILNQNPTWDQVPLWDSEYGHCIFFNTKEYRKLGGENEEFKSYGPEDKERAKRFERLGKKVKWLDGVIFHFEHYRGNDSSRENPYLNHNNKILESLESMSPDEILSYYNNIGYRKKYKKMKLGI